MNQVEFFDNISTNWDSIIEVNPKKINLLLSKLDISDNCNILDVGTGTGVLIPFLKDLNPNGFIKGVDISKGMLAMASNKFKNLTNVSFNVLDIENSNLDYKFDNIILYSMFPHLRNKTKTIKKLIDNNLKDHGKLMIAHSSSRDFINKIHRETDDIVSEDRLIPIFEQKKLFEDVNLKVVDAFENDEIYYLILEK